MKRILLISFLLIGSKIFGQSLDIDALEVNAFKPKLNGGINLSSNYNSNLNTSNRLNYFLSGNINLSINQFSLPVSFNYSDRKFNYSQAYNFNQLSFNPTFKWASAQIGTSYLNFSPTTLNGHQFFGVGAELKPNNWDIKIMAGRLLKATSLDSLTGPTFNRMGYGAKIRHNFSEKLSLGTTVFYASDKASSLPEENWTFNDQSISPEENLVIGFDMTARPINYVELNLEYTNSIINQPAQDSLVPLKLNSLAGIFIKENSTAVSYNAFKSNINYNIMGSGTIVGFGYERIDPGYKTMGGYYFLNDLENITANLSTSLWQNILSIQAQLGFQKDDIEKQKATGQNRFVASANMNIRPNQNLGINLTYTNFKSYMFVRDAYQEITRVPGQPIDSLNFSQISRNIGLGISQTLKNREDLKSAINLNANFLLAEGRNGSIIREETKSNILNASAAYSLNFPKSEFGISAGANLNQNKYEGGNIKGYGPTVSLQKLFFNKKVQTSLSSSVLYTKTTENSFKVYNFLLSANYQPLKKHNLNLNAGIIGNELSENYQNANLGYSISF